MRKRQTCLTFGTNPDQKREEISSHDSESHFSRAFLLSIYCRHTKESTYTYQTLSRPAESFYLLFAFPAERFLLLLISSQRIFAVLVLVWGLSTISCESHVTWTQRKPVLSRAAKCAKTAQIFQHWRDRVTVLSVTADVNLHHWTHIIGASLWRTTCTLAPGQIL